MCLSGEVDSLNDTQWAAIQRCMMFYKRHTKIIQSPEWYRYGEESLSYRHPEGWQGFLSVDTLNKEALLLLHTFNLGAVAKVTFELPKGRTFEIEEVLAHKDPSIEIVDGAIHYWPNGDFVAIAVKMKCRHK